MATVLIRNARIPVNDDLIEASMLIENEFITCIRKDLSVNADKTINAKSWILLPGGIDPHAHMYDPEFYYKEDYDSGSKSALIGGVTTVIDMPLVHDVDNAQKLRDRIEVGLRNSRIDFAIHGGFMRKNNHENLRILAEQGIRSFKVFTCSPYEASDDVIFKLMKDAKITNSILTFHAEDGALLSEILESLKDRKDAIVVHEARPPEAEELAIMKIGLYSVIMGSSVHIAHISSSSGVKVVNDLKDRKVDVTAETTPHHLTFTIKDVEKLGPYLKVAPSLKGGQDIEELWRGLNRGVIDMVATDHAPCPKEEKEVGWEDPWKAWSGIPGLATMIPLLFTNGLLKNRLTLKRFVEVVSTTAAERFGLRYKGKLVPGYHADITLVDPKEDRKVTGELYGSGWTPYEGMMLRGWPKMVMLRGRVVVEEGVVYAKPGYGKFIKMERSPLDIKSLEA
jgi:dihydroorotase (multifunctional complex type)